MKKKTIVPYIALFLLPFLCAAILFLIQNGFGSTIDWYGQHIAIGDQFRQSFYQSGRLFPDMLNLGAGQSVYHFAYYGLYRYDILLSYLFPSFNMSVILPILHLTSLSVSICLFYYFLTRHVSSKLALFGSLCFLLSAPLLYHVEKQVTFVIYFPFVISGLIGCDRYLNTKNSSLYLFSITMCIITSFYFSVGSMLTWFLYCLMHTKRQDWWKQFQSLFTIHLKAILLSAFFWLPTAYAIVTTHAKQTTSLSFLSMLIPDFSAASFLYSPYSIGLGILFLLILVLWAMSYEKPSLISIVIICLILFPLLLLCMNLFLYARAKALIPLIPLILYLGVLWFHQNHQLSKWEIMVLLLLSMIISFYQSHPFLTLIDCILAIIILVYHPKRELYLIYLPLMCIIFFAANLSETKMKIKTIQEIDRKQAMIQQLSLDPSARIADYHENAQSMNLDVGLPKSSIYSSIHLNTYNQFYYDEMQNNLSLRNRVATLESGNPFFLAMLHHRYLISDKQAPPFYKTKYSNGDWTLYETNQVLPFAYGTSEVMSKSQYETLSFPENMMQMLYRPIVSHADNVIFSPRSTSTKEAIQIIDHSNDGQWYQKKQQHIHISSKQQEQMTLQLQKPLISDYLIVSFDIQPTSTTYPDLSITINGMRNRLSASNAPYPNHHTHMTFYIAPTDVISLSFSKGDYLISNLETHRIALTNFKELNQSKIPVTNETYHQNTNDYQANITMKESGWLITSLPYQKGIKVMVDDQTITPQIVNHSFIGFPITKGKHLIRITFDPPLQTFGRIISLTTFIYLCLHRKRRNLCKTKSKKPSYMSCLDVSLQSLILCCFISAMNILPFH